MDIALLVLRVIVGLLMAGHGAQKLFGSFGGHGIDGTAGFMESLGMRPGRRHATAAGTAELAGGALLALGLITPLGAALVIGVMVVAIAMVHAKNGPWVSDGGFEYNLVIIATCFALAGAGPGNFSLDNAIGWMPDITGAGWAFIALGVGLLGGMAAMMSGRREATAPRRREPVRPETAPVADERSDRFVHEADDATIEQRRRPGIPADPR